MVRVKEELRDLQPYKPGKPVDEVKRELGLKEAIKLASNENPFGPSRLALTALRKNLREVNRYPDGGCYYLRKKLAKIHSVSEDQLVFGNGSDELIVLAIRALLRYRLEHSRRSRKHRMLSAPRPSARIHRIV